jgi:hypothetical protein
MGHKTICAGNVDDRLLEAMHLCIRDVAEIENISIKKVLSVLVRSRHMIQPGQPYYDCLEVDEFWTYAGKKSNRV